MPPKVTKGEYVETETGNKISRRAHIHGTQHIILGGKTIIQSEACLRGDLHRLPSCKPTSSVSASDKDAPGKEREKEAPLTAINIGRYVFISPHSLLQPPSRLSHGVHTYHRLQIGDHVYIGPEATVTAASIGNYVHIERGAVVGNLCIIKDFVKILEGAVLPDGMVVPSYTVIAGRPARVVGQVGEGWGVWDGMEGGSGRERYRTVR